MKAQGRIILLITFLFSALVSQAQLFDKLMNKDKKEKVEKKEAVVTEEKSDEASKFSLLKKKDEEEVLDKRHFTYKNYTLNTDVTKDYLDSCVTKSNTKVITDMQYYEQGEDMRFKENNDVSVTLRFLDDTERLIGIYVEDIDDIAYVNQLQQLVLKQMGEPTMGFEVMKNYDGTSNNLWTDYSTYEYMFRYVIGTNVYDFQVTQYGAKMKNGKVVHPYNFAATVNKKSEVALKMAENLGADEPIYDENGKPKEEKKKKEMSDDEKIKENFYPQVGVQQFGDYTMELKMLRKW